MQLAEIFANVVVPAAAAAAVVVAAVAEIARKRSLQRCSLANCAEFQCLITPLMCNFRIIVIVVNSFSVEKLSAIVFWPNRKLLRSCRM